jgi:hypothetical protein
MRKISRLAAVAVLAVSATYAHADSIIDVTLHFTVTSGSPTPTGSFVVDVDGKQTVESFTVDWDGAVYNLAPPNQVPPISGYWCAVAPDNVTSVCGGRGIFALNEFATAPEDPAMFTDNVAAASGTYSYTFKGTMGVPEPATVGLLSLGLAGVGFARRKRES